MTKDYIKEAYAKLKAKLDRQPSLNEFHEQTTVSPWYLLKGGFRTFSQLVEEMGDTPKEFSNKSKSKEEFLINYGNMVKQLGYKPTTSDWAFNKGKPAVSNYMKKFELAKWADMATLFVEYAKDLEEWSVVVKLLPERTSSNTSIVFEKKQNDECYVYFMYDTKTCCYKIGISNEPDWREKTLQSEKPSIKLIAEKKFVNRRIAANIEKALHDSYSHKRKRGEWFQLDREDIEEIKITLTQ
jgi:hypothetical protein